MVRKNEPPTKVVQTQKALQCSTVSFSNNTDKGRKCNERNKMDI